MSVSSPICRNSWDPSDSSGASGTHRPSSLVAVAHFVVDGHAYSLAPWRDVVRAFAEYPTLFGLVVSLMALLAPPASASLSWGASLVTVALRIAATLFALLLTLAIRRRVRR